MEKKNISLIILSILILALALGGCTRLNDGKIGSRSIGRDNGSQEKQLINDINELEKDLNSTASDTKTLDEEVKNSADNTANLSNQAADTASNKREENTGEDNAVVIDEEKSSELQRIEVSETDLVKLDINVTDKDKDNINLTFSAPLDENGEWQTDYQDEGEYVVSVKADDGVNTVEKKVLLVVDKKNVAPTINNLSDEINAKEGDVIRLKFNVNDLNGDNVKLSFSSPFDGSGIWNTDHTSAGEYEVEVSASDGEKETKKNVRVNVEDVNVPPEIITAKDIIRVKEGDIVKIDYKISDLDGDKVNVTISDPVGNDGVWETGYTDNGEYNIIIKADDGKDITEKNITLKIEDVNVPPEIIDIRLG